MKHAPHAFKGSRLYRRYLLLDALAKFPVVHVQVPPSGSRTKVPKCRQQIGRAPPDLPNVFAGSIAGEAAEGSPSQAVESHKKLVNTTENNPTEKVFRAEAYKRRNRE